MQFLQVIGKQQQSNTGTFRPKREEMVAGWRRLYNEELCNMYASPNIITVIKSKRIRWMGYAAHMGNIRNAYNTLVRKPEGKRPHG
jgi:retron-type reverse transcriptase